MAAAADPRGDHPKTDIFAALLATGIKKILFFISFLHYQSLLPNLMVMKTTLLLDLFASNH
jgi:hypothetical protein